MDPVASYAINRRPHLIMAMVGAALRSLPHQTGTLRGSSESEARAAYVPVAEKVLDQMKDGQTINDSILWSTGSHIVAQFGMGIAVAMLNELYAKLCPKRTKHRIRQMTVRQGHNKILHQRKTHHMRSS